MSSGTSAYGSAWGNVLDHLCVASDQSLAEASNCQIEAVEEINYPQCSPSLCSWNTVTEQHRISEQMEVPPVFIFDNKTNLYRLNLGAYSEGEAGDSLKYDAGIQ